MSRTKKKECEKFIDEAVNIDSNKKAKDTIEYEQMLMNFIESQFTDMIEDTNA